jgi:diguanylate cyclase (GGDEF)-like protein
VFDDMVGLAARMTGSPIAIMRLLDQERHWISSEVPVDPVEISQAVPVAAPGEPILVPDARLDPRLSSASAVLGGPGIRACLGISLPASGGGVLGTLCVMDREPRDYAPSHSDTLRRVAHALATTIEMRRSLAQASALALTDALTGLANRRGFIDSVSRAISRQRRDAQPFALLYLDLDGFKAVNDGRGHAAGDRVLEEVAAALRASIRHEDMAARLGGDEFGVLLVGGNGDEAAVAADRVRQAVNRRMQAGGWDVTASIGAVSFLVPPADTAEAIAVADGLMYGAKRRGKDTVLRQDYLGARRDAPAVGRLLIG